MRNVRLGALTLTLCVAAACGGGDSSDPYVRLSSASAEWGGSAEVRAQRCGNAWCEGLWLGPTSKEAVQLIQLQQGSRCQEIAWSKDGRRVAFVVDGYQLWVFDTVKQVLLSRLNLVEVDALPPSRIARGITFSDNGAAITFDRCPRAQSGCEPRMMGLY